VRFLFVDRIIDLDPGRTIETIKNVSATEDVFADHFPGSPIFPGALVVESFEQASQLLIAVSHDFASVGRLRAVHRGAFRHFVRPGDQLRVRCVRTHRRTSGATGDDEGWTVSATAEVDGRRVASATLDFAIVVAVDADKEHAERLREHVRVLRATPIDMTRGGDGA
jgi:3-hydroxyacyl-[acyl-carrier-protein] dehydratase